jgi:predicted secreted protein
MLRAIISPHQEWILRPAMRPAVMTEATIKTKIKTRMKMKTKVELKAIISHSSQTMMSSQEFSWNLGKALPKYTRKPRSA